ncbi:MAG: hypothetical protein HWN65_20000 [Candidatus Helarchaeota archaeon]|nr:hypothetical protein [Candidatus Helarchaeota archaeon]
MGWLIYYHILMFADDLKDWGKILFVFVGEWLMVAWISTKKFVSKSNARYWIIGVSMSMGIFWGSFILIALFYWIGILPLTAYQLGLIFTVTLFFSHLILPVLIGFYFFYLKSIPPATTENSDLTSLNKLKEYGFGLAILVGFLQAIIWFVFPAFSLFGFDFLF